ncbi:MAG: 3-isopropylmalate dehydrogenase [Eubacteriales bacterium]|nr:3-isopropylmalate dehydrogenase [Eubacteriales bacterium]
MSKFRIAVIPGDGIGPEVSNASREVLDAVAVKYGHSFIYEELLAGGIAIDVTGTPLPKSTVAACRSSDAVLLGAVGGPKWDTLPGDQRPERALLGLRSELGLFANIRPAVLHPALASACPLHPDTAAKGIDICFVRELTGGMYFGERGRRQSAGGEEAYDTEAYNVEEVKRIAHTAFKIAMGRKKHVTSVDKANVLESSRLWREVVLDVAKEYPEVELDHMYVDNASMQLIKRPGDFDVVVTSNMFGDILSDEAAMITGSIGMLPSASLGAEGTPGMYEPIHGSAPDIAGKHIANPLATILSCAMMLRMSLGLEREAEDIETAVADVLSQGYRTADIVYGERSDDNVMVIGTFEMSGKVKKSLIGIK